MKSLIVIDMQNDFIGTKKVVPIVPKDKLVITTRDTHGSDYMDTLEGKKLPVPHCIYS